MERSPLITFVSNYFGIKLPTATGHTGVRALEYRIYWRHRAHRSVIIALIKPMSTTDSVNTAAVKLITTINPTGLQTMQLAATDSTRLQELQYQSYWPPLISPDYKHCNTEATDHQRSQRTTNKAALKLLAATDPTGLQPFKY